MSSKSNQAEDAADQRSLWNLKKSGTMIDYLLEGTIKNDRLVRQTVPRTIQLPFDDDFISFNNLFDYPPAARLTIFGFSDTLTVCHTISPPPCERASPVQKASVWDASF